MTTIVRASSCTFTIWIAGNYDDCVRACRQFCHRQGACFSVRRAFYAYTGGAEDGVAVTLINYPRFQKSPTELEALALELGAYLCEELCQHSYSVEGPVETIWVSNRPL